MPVNAHMLVPKALPGEGTLAPLPLKITPKALLAGICEQLHIQGTGPVCIVEEANPIPDGEVGEPPLNVIPKFCVQADAVVEVLHPLGGLYHLP